MKIAALLTQDLLKVTRVIDARQRTFGGLLNDSLMATELHQTITNLKLSSSEGQQNDREMNQML